MFDSNIHPSILFLPEHAPALLSSRCIAILSFYINHLWLTQLILDAGHLQYGSLIIAYRGYAVYDNAIIMQVCKCNIHLLTSLNQRVLHRELLRDVSC